MAKIILYTDLSAGYGATFTALASQRAALKERGLFMPFPGTSLGVPSHNDLWVQAAHPVAETSQHPSELLQEITKLAEEERHILLWTAAIMPELHQRVLNDLRQLPALKNYQFSMFFMLGRMACRLEQDVRRIQYRRGKMPSLPAMMNLTQRRYLVADLLTLARQECGADHVDVLVDSGESCSGRGDAKMLGKVFGYLGCPPPEHVPPYPLAGIDSQRRTRLINLLRTRNNQWPPVQESVFTQYLQLQGMESDEPWLASPSSVRARALALERECLPRLAKLAGCSKDSLSMPRSMYPDVPRTECPPVSEEDARTFVSFLPEETKKELNLQCRREMPMLSSEERLLASAFGASSPRRPEPLLTVLTLAYNQAAYIGEAIESVLAQRTDFPVEHIIVDHCSTDGTREIIADYARKHASIWPVFLARRNSKGANVRALFSRCRSRYAALCDGDDYFTDPRKLQKQVDFLETHPECGLCFHPVDVMYEDGSPSRVYPPEDILPSGIQQFNTIKDLLFANFIQTNSVVYRWRFTEGLPDWFDATLVPGDWYWHLLHAETGLIGYLREHMAVYRRHATSLYATAEGDLVAHRGIHGLNELHAYDVVNRHFHGRYYTDIKRLVTGVFADFLKIYLRTGDDTLLQRGCSDCPDFARDFLAQVRENNGKSQMRA